MRVRPISPQALAAELADTVAMTAPGRRLRVAIDAPAAARPGDLADALVEPLRASGRDVVRVSAWDFLRPASLRYEFGRYDPDAFYDDWLDAGGLTREVLGPAETTGKILPSLWDRERDRATRAEYVGLAEGGIVLLDGTLLLGRGLPLDLTVHLTMSYGALARRTPEEDAWTLPAYASYEEDVRPDSTADIVVKVDDPRHPALIMR